MVGYGLRSTTRTTREGSRKASGRRRTPLTTVKIAVFAPMPRASVRTATAAKPGFLISIRTPYFKSCRIVFIQFSLCNTRTSCNVLLVSQRDQRIDARGAARGEITGGYRYDRQACGDTAQRQRICRFHAVELALQVTHGKERASHAESESNSREAHTVADDHAQNIARLGAKGHANADFMRALRHGVTHHAVNSDGGEQSSNHGEKSEQEHTHTPLRNGSGKKLVHGANLRDRLILVKARNDLANGRDELRGIAVGANHDAHEMRRNLCKRDVELRDVGLVPLPLADIGYDTYDGRPRIARLRLDWGTGRCKERANLFANGILVRPVAASKRFVDENDALRGGPVGGGEIAAFLQRNVHGADVAPVRDAILGGELLTGGLDRPASDIEIAIAAPSGLGQKIDAARRLYAGQRLDAINELLVKIDDRLVGVVASFRQPQQH